MSKSYAFLKREKVAVEQLAIGMFVSELDRPWKDTTFLMQGFSIAVQEDIDELKKQCKFVYVEFSTEQQYQHYLNTTNQLIDGDAQANIAEGKFTYPGSIKKQRIQSDYQSRYKAKEVIKKILKSVNEEDDYEVGEIKDIVNQCVESILDNPGSMMLLSQIKRKDDYTAEHCLNVSVLSIAFAKFIGHSVEDLQLIGLCGMLHDIGKIKVPLHILTKPSCLSTEELTEMRKHAEYGYKILTKKTEPQAVIDSAYCHHERLNGSGYPQGLIGEQIPYYARLVAIVDSYDAITSQRVYSGSRSVMDTFKILREGSGDLYDAELIEKFTEWLGVYPPGTIVKMSNQEVAIVLEVNHRFRLKPIILIVRDANNQVCREKLLDLSDSPLDEQSEKYRISSTLPIDVTDIHLEKTLAKYFDFSIAE